MLIHRTGRPVFCIHLLCTEVRSFTLGALRSSSKVVICKAFPACTSQREIPLDCSLTANPFVAGMLNRVLGGPRMGSPRPRAPLLLLLQHSVAGHGRRIPRSELQRLLQVPAGLSSAQSTERGEKIPESFIPRNSGGGEEAQSQHLGCPSSSGERRCVKEVATLVIGAHGKCFRRSKRTGHKPAKFCGAQQGTRTLLLPRDTKLP